jgi:hypothetical protein
MDEKVLVVVALGSQKWIRPEPSVFEALRYVEDIIIPAGMTLYADVYRHGGTSYELVRSYTVRNLEAA